MSFSDIGVDFLALETHLLYLITCHCGFIQDQFYSRSFYIVSNSYSNVLFILFISIFIYLYLSSKIFYNLLFCLIRSQWNWWIFQFYVLVRDSTNLTKPGYYLFERMEDDWNINFSRSAKIRINIIVFLLIKEIRL